MKFTEHDEEQPDDSDISDVIDISIELNVMSPNPFVPLLLKSKARNKNGRQIIDEHGQIIERYSLSGDILTMPCCKGRTQKFEMHKYHGPIPLRKDNEPTTKTAQGFWEMYKKWCDTGKLIKGNTCWIPACKRKKTTPKTKPTKPPTAKTTSSRKHAKAASIPRTNKKHRKNT